MMEKRGIITEQTQAEDIHDRHIASRLTDEAADAFRRK